MAMKNIPRFVLVIALAVMPSLTMAQNKVVTLPINANKQIEYIENLSIPGATQTQLFKKALNWMVGSKAYKFRKINLMDNSYGRLIADGKFILNNEEVFLSLTVDVKDNKAQLKVSRFDYNMQIGNIALDNLTNTKAKDVKILTPLVATAMTVLIKDFREAMIKKL